GLAAIDMFRTLSLYNLAFQFNDGAAQSQMQKLAIEELQGQLAGLHSSGSLAGYDDGDGICPDWWPFPWPRPHMEIDTVAEGTPLPALVLRDLLRSLIYQNIALRFTDGAAQTRSAEQARQQIR